MRTVVVLSVSLVAALTLAYVTWTREETEVSDDAVALFQASEADVSKISYTTDKMTVVLEKRKDERGEYFWVDSTEKKPKKKAREPKAPDAPPEDPHAPPEAAEPEELETVHQVFVAGTAGEDLWKSLSPLEAMRELARPADLATFGLTEPSGTLEIARAAGPVTLRIGGETFGAKDRYVEFEGKVFLVDDAKLKPLEFAGTRMMERGLFPLQQKEIDRLEVQLPDGAKVGWTQVNKDDATKAAWTRPENPTVADEVGATWINKVLGLKLQSYVDGDPGSLSAVFGYAVASGKETWRVQIFKSTAEPAEWYAKTDFNRSLVKLTDSMVRSVVDDLPSVAVPPAPVP